MTIGELPVGAVVIDKDTRYYGEPIKWKILEHNHEGEPENSTALITDKIISFKCVDAAEPKNTNNDRKTAGNNRYLYSNLLQWLNSEEKSIVWYKNQHVTDQPPEKAYVRNGNAYYNESGFLRGFSNEFKRNMLESTKQLVKPQIDGGGYEYVTRKVHILTNTEMGLTDEYTGKPEGIKYALFSSDSSRIAYPTEKAVKNNEYVPTQGNVISSTNPWYYWTSSSLSGTSQTLRDISFTGGNTSGTAFNGSNGIRPMCVVSSSIEVFGTEDENTYYLFSDGEFPEEPMDGIWRTPKTDWTEKDAFNLKDYKRIRNNLLFLRNKISDIWGEFSIEDMGNDPSDPRYIWKAQYFNSIEENLETINKRMIIVKNYGYKQTFYNNGSFIGFSELNRIESATLQMKRIIEGWEAGLRKLSFRLGAPKGLYL